MTSCCERTLQVVLIILDFVVVTLSTVFLIVSHRVKIFHQNLIAILHFTVIMLALAFLGRLVTYTYQIFGIIPGQGKEELYCCFCT